MGAWKSAIATIISFQWISSENIRRDKSNALHEGLTKRRKISIASTSKWLALSCNCILPQMPAMLFKSAVFFALLRVYHLCNKSQDSQRQVISSGSLGITHRMMMTSLFCSDRSFAHYSSWLIKISYIPLRDVDGLTSSPFSSHSPSFMVGTRISRLLSMPMGRKSCAAYRTLFCMSLSLTYWLISCQIYSHSHSYSHLHTC